MPIHLDWRQKITLKKHNIISNHLHEDARLGKWLGKVFDEDHAVSKGFQKLLKGDGANREMAKNISLDEALENQQMTEARKRVRTYTNYQSFTKAVAVILSQIPAGEQREFGDNGQVGFAVRFHLTSGAQGARIHLIFAKGSTVAVATDGDINVTNSARMPNTKLKRIEATTGDGGLGVIWSR